MSPWRVVTREHQGARQLADRHYTRRPKQRGKRVFAAPGGVLVLLAESFWGRAAWVTRRSDFDKHQWPGAWCCTLFRNEGPWLSSRLIEQAVSRTHAAWGRAPHGWVTFVDPSKVKSTNPGFCFLQAGWKRIGWTPGGHGRKSLLVLGLGVAA